MPSSRATLRISERLKREILCGVDEVFVAIVERGRQLRLAQDGGGGGPDEFEPTPEVAGGRE